MTRKLRSALAFILAMLCLISTAACGGNTEESSAPADGSTDASDIISEVLSEEESDAEESSKAEEKSWLPEITGYTDTDAEGKAQRDPNYKAVNYEKMRGIWMSQYDMMSLYRTGDGQKPEDRFEVMIDKICAAVVKAGLNTIVVQLRPNGDSFYPSDLYAPSYYVVGAYGNEFEYDMLKVFIRIAHSYGLSFHAWVNPMRLMSGDSIEDTDDKYVIKQWYNDPEKREYNLYEHTDELYYLVPGVQENKQLVWDGVTEICKRYNVDAVNIDDYFYPTTADAFDAEHFSEVCEDFGGNNGLARRRYRLDAVNTLVHGMYEAVKAVDPSIWFGISPAGSISNNLTTLYADVNTWCKYEGYCDYIIPQVYWGFENVPESQKFDVCSTDWQKICTNDNIRLMIGIGLYRWTSTEDEFAEYKEKKESIKRQLEFLETMEKNDGFVFYTFADLFHTNGTYTGNSRERKAMLPVLKKFGGDLASTIVPVPAE